eukprot:1742607-Amphidinium_carterae.1
MVRRAVVLAMMPNCARSGKPIPPRTVGSRASLRSSCGNWSPTIRSKALSCVNCNCCSKGWREGAGTALMKCISTAGKKVRTIHSTI